jgi:hypothetical protein
MVAKVDGAEEVSKPGRDCVDVESKCRKEEVFQRDARLKTGCRPILSTSGQSHADAQRRAQSIFRTTRNRLLCRGGIGRQVMEDFLNSLR